MVAASDEEESQAQSAEGDAKDVAVDGPVPKPPRIPLRAINAVSRHLPTVEAARIKVTTEMENMVMTGLSTLVCPLSPPLSACSKFEVAQNQSLLASSLQTAFNLRVLPQLVQSLVVDLTDAVEGRIRFAFDLSKLTKEAAAAPKGTELFFSLVDVATVT